MNNQISSFDAIDSQFLKLRASDSDRKVSRLIPQSSEALQSYQDTIGGAWETLIGRRDDQVGNVAYRQKSVTKRPEVVIQAGSIRNTDHEEEFPVLKFVSHQRTENPVSVIWVTDQGKMAAFENGKVLDEIL